MERVGNPRPLGEVGAQRTVAGHHEVAIIGARHEYQRTAGLEQSTQVQGDAQVCLCLGESILALRATEHATVPRIERDTPSPEGGGVHGPESVDPRVVAGEGAGPLGFRSARSGPRRPGRQRLPRRGRYRNGRASGREAQEQQQSHCVHIRTTAVAHASCEAHGRTLASVPKPGNSRYRYPESPGWDRAGAGGALHRARGRANPTRLLSTTATIGPGRTLAPALASERNLLPSHLRKE